MIHIGLYTITLKGEGFTLLVEEGKRFNEGDKLVTVNRNVISKRGLLLITPVVLTNLDKEQYEIVVDKVGKVARNETRLFM